MDYAKFDSLAAAIEYGRQIGLKIWAWASINEDDHGWGWPSEFTKAHPEFRWVRRDGRVYHSQLSFAFPEVRKYKLALIDELLTNYDLDGLFLDWIRTGDVRDNPQTDAKGIADNGYEAPNLDAFKLKYGVDPHEVANDDERWARLRAEPQTLFMRTVRERVNKHHKRVPITVMVGHPWHYRGLQDPIDGNLRGLLLDVATWANEGLIDAAIAAGYYRPGGNPSKAFEALCAETNGKSRPVVLRLGTANSGRILSGLRRRPQIGRQANALLGGRLDRRPAQRRRAQASHVSEGEMVTTVEANETRSHKDSGTRRLARKGVSLFPHLRVSLSQARCFSNQRVIRTTRSSRTSIPYPPSASPRPWPAPARRAERIVRRRLFRRAGVGALAGSAGGVGVFAGSAAGFAGFSSTAPKPGGSGV